MPVIVDEHTQYMDIGGKPLLAGKVFIGVVNQDPVLNPEPIFSDPALSIALTNPQPLNSRGQTVSKIYVAGRYSFKLEDFSGSQIEQDLDRGSVPAIGITALTNIQGTDDITASANNTIAAYVDKAQFSLTIINSPTGATTLNIDGLGAITIKNKGVDILPGQLLANGIIVVAFNIIGPVFELVSGANLSVPPPIGDITPNNIEGTTIDATISFKAASGTAINEFSTDGTLAGDSNDAVPTEQAVKTAISLSLATANLGKILQVNVILSSEKIQSTTAIPVDDTIPQISEGTAAMELAITPILATSTILVIANCGVACQVAGALTVSLFQDAIVDALAAEFWQFVISGGTPVSYGSPVTLVFSHSAVSTTARTYKIRFGPSGTGGGGNSTFNGISNARLYSTIPKSSLLVLEVGV